VLGVVFDSTSLEGVEDSIDAGVANITKLTVMIGGPYWDTYRSSSSSTTTLPTSEDLSAIAFSHLQSVFPGIPQPLFTRSSIHKNCIPTYLVGHGTRLRELHEAVISSEWNGYLTQTGSGYGGVGVNDCIGMGWGVADGLQAGWVSGLERWEDWE
jgi:protoporphyrinogen/coproporphyrinogen III oxidase